MDLRRLKGKKILVGELNTVAEDNLSLKPETETRQGTDNLPRHLDIFDFLKFKV